ncbi:hypothetical protein CXB51_017488 [Gossypium anomalum]|uniref:Piwi domain-containing protein n=1 Tax=Gossypium anomalum TaxID=47600 RepID=A0A8J5YNH6_9ROSI|nr:hypothetical protein CXB51_017488 [Gossypium anomalum]
MGSMGIKAKQLFYNNYGDSQYLLDLGIDKNLFRAITQYWNLVYSCFTFGKADMVSVVEEYSVLWRCPMIQVYSKADRIPTFMRKLMNVMGIGSELKWKEQEGKWVVLEFLPLPPLVRLNVVSNQSRIGYEEDCSTLYGKAKMVDGKSVGRKVIDRMHGPTKEFENSQETLKLLDIILGQHVKQEYLLVCQSFFQDNQNNFTDVGRGVHRCRDYLVGKAIRDGSRSFTDHEEKGLFGNENHPINVIHEEGTEQRNLEGIRPYKSRSSLNNWTTEELPDKHEVLGHCWSTMERDHISCTMNAKFKEVKTYEAFVSNVPTIILGMGALFGFPEQYDVSSIATMILSSKPVSDKVDDGIMKEALLDFYTSSGKMKPDQIIIFRDGVSEYQFNQVLIKLLKLASSLTRSGTLKIVVIVGSPDNVLHGTVIDNKVCHPKNNDFYLGTHARLIGITRQTHYHVLLDQAGFSADNLQEFLHSWGQFMKIRDASETSSSHGGMYVPGVISIPQLSKLKDKVSNFILVC